MSEDSKHKTSTMSSWSDCPAEILQLVLSRLTSPGDLAYFPAVCTWWRSVSLLDGRRPAAPRHWLMAYAPPSADQSTLFSVCLEDTGRVFRRPVPEALRQGQCCGSAGYGFLAVFQRKPLGGREIVLVDPFSTAEPPPLSLAQRILGISFGEVNRVIRWRGGASRVRKVVLSAVPSSAKCFVAAIVGDDRERGSLVVWDARSPGGRRLKLDEKDGLNDMDFHDVAFCNGELIYAITSTENLICLKIKGGAITVGRLDIAPRQGDHYDGWRTSPYPRHNIQVNYLVVVPVPAGTSDRRRLLMVVRRVPGLQNSRVPRFRVFELERSREAYEWKQIDILDHAIFLGRGCSAAVDVSDHDAVKKDIYFAADWYSSCGDWERTRDHGEGIYCISEYSYSSSEPLPESSVLAANMIGRSAAPAMWFLLPALIGGQNGPTPEINYGPSYVCKIAY